MIRAGFGRTRKLASPVMKRRYVYALLFAPPSLLASFIAALALLGAIAGALWLFVYGDEAWPAALGPVLTVAFGVTWAVAFAALLRAAYRAGMRVEGAARLDRRAVMGSAGATAAALLLFTGYQWRVGNIGPQSEGVRCAEFCRDKGFAGSGMPPRNAGAATCSCFDAQGREVVKVPIGEAARPEAPVR